MNRQCAVYPGSFDPPTNGHLDILLRASQLFPQVIVAVTDNRNKNPSFSLAERLTMLRTLTKKIPNVRVDSFSGLLVDYVEQSKASVIIRGLRAVADFEYEYQMALMNRRLNRNVVTVFLMPDEAYTYLSSSVVREVARLGGTVKGLVDPIVEKKLKTLYRTT
ncbi:MAG: pantetheine-phosphate adenylyltransferase [Endomicrobiales bacterium]|jgi:pantetheine-phosphate adenylyltransferase